MLYYSSIALLLGFILDCILGDPHNWWHPVQGIGYIIEFWESQLLAIFPATPKGERTAGYVLVFLVIATTMIIPSMLVIFAYGLHWSVGIIVEAVLCYQMLAAKSLMMESAHVASALKISLDDGRKAVGMIVGRDTDKLDREGVIKAAVETVAENTSDGIIAPMFYMAIGGGVLGYIYKAVNTMDSMVGYKNEKYIDLGMAAAKFDDIVNWIPARLSAGLMIIAAYLLKMNPGDAERIFMRDRYNHDSPNSAQTEAVMAGALGVQLAGDAWYFGKLKKKKTIGDPTRKIVVEDIANAHRLMYATTLLGLVGMVSIRLIVAVGVSLISRAIGI